MVDIQITGVHYDVSERLREHVGSKLGALERFSVGLQHLHVIIRKEANFGCRVDVEMRLTQGKDLVAHDSAETVYAAVDAVVDKCAAQLRKTHDKKARHRSDRIQVRT